jgi:hypothetical protein
MSRQTRGVREPHADSTPERLPTHRSSGRSALILGLSVLLVASCGSSSPTPSPMATTSPATPRPTVIPTPTMVPTIEPTSTPTMVPTIEPTPTPIPTATPPPPVTEDQLAAACAGTPIPGAAAYSGSLHPLVVNYVDAAGDWVVEMYKFSYFYPINAKWYDGTWPGAIQLVLCVPAEKAVKVGSCGRYKRAGDGKVGEVIRYKESVTVRVVVALTGRTLQSKTFYGTVPACSKSLPDPGTNPPWRIYGNDPSHSAINKYAVAVSTQSTR